MILKTERLILRPFRESNAEGFDESLAGKAIGALRRYGADILTATRNQSDAERSAALYTITFSISERL